ncbi:MAG TPA: hypothetical protein VFQ54_04620, partial [Thermomicrobiales bacterium]|nr:hypothetical protein [Thermomicrobiales bacterium]
MSALEAWRSYGFASELTYMQSRYDELWSLYTGEAFANALRQSAFRTNRQVYRNTRLIWKHVEGVVDWYVGTVYQGDLSTDGARLPDGTYGAIPIHPQGLKATDEKNLRTAIGELFDAWNYKQQMSIGVM